MVMLRLLFGTSADEKLNIYSHEIKRLLDENKSVLAIVPDQFSFEYDKILYQTLGARDFNRVSVLSFKKISEDLIQAHGTYGKTLLKPQERICVIYSAIRRVKKDSKLRLLGTSLDKPSFVCEMSELLDTLIRSGTEPDELCDCARKLGGGLADKLEDISKIYRAYLSELSDGGFRDQSSVVYLGSQLAEKSGYFKDKYVYVDRFERFSKDELTMLEKAAKASPRLSVALTLPLKYKKSAISPYAAVEETEHRLSMVAKATNTRLEFELCQTADHRPAGIKAVESAFLGENDRISDESVADGSVKAYSCATIYEEADYVAATIRSGVMRGEYGYNDVAVLTRDISSYQSALESAFERYDVPYFMDGKTKASDMSVALYCFAAIDAASTRKPSTDRIMKLVCSPFSGLREDEISKLEDYCVRWNVDGDMWLSEFTAEEDDFKPEEANPIRKKVIEPLRRLHESCRGATAAQICQAFMDYIRECGLAEEANSVVEEYTPGEEKITASRLFTQLWNTLMDSVSAIYTSIGDKKLSLREFGELLKLMLSDTGIANPPQKLSSVTVCDISRSVITSVKAAFVVGVNDGKFPPDAKKTGIFSGKDAAILEANGLSFSESEKDRLVSERYLAFRALTCAVNKLYISYSDSDLAGGKLRPSYLMGRLNSRLGLKYVKASDLPEELYCSTPQAAYYRLMISRKMSSSDRTAVTASLMRLPEYAKKLSSAGEKDGNDRRLSPQIAKRLFVPGELNTSSSRIDVYNHCHFRYFLMHGLRLKTVQPVRVDPASRGSVMHYVFQHILDCYGSDFEHASDGELEEKVRELLDEYERLYLGGSFGKSEKYKADYRRLRRACMEVLLNIREEYRRSKFRPEKFEYVLSAESGRSVLSIPIGSSGGRVKINLRGIVDRVDSYTASDGKKYIRIIDYKTGSKEFRFEDVYNGINLQMLLYMLALTEGISPEFSDCIPAGVLYMKAGYLRCEPADSEGDSPAGREKRAAKQFERSGLVISNDEIIAAMDYDISGDFAPVKAAKSSKTGYTKWSSLIPEDCFKRLEEFAKKKLAEFGHGLVEGEISAIPTSDSQKKHLTCEYCEYTSVCTRKKYICKPIYQEDAKKLMAEIGLDADTKEGSNAELD